MLDSPPQQRTAITIGNFDGVHLGHAALVHAARQSAGPHGRVVVLSFDPHPATVLRPGSEPRRLTSFEQRREWLKHLGANDVIPLVPTPKLLSQSAKEFVTWLMAEHHPTAIVEGPDFRFGHNRKGSIQKLREMESTYGYQTIIVDPVEIALSDQSVVRASSTLIRWLVSRGRVRDARLVLGRAYELRATVARGDARGRELGVPTANLALPDDCLLPADGIYAGIATAPDGTLYPAAVSVGTKPTFGTHPRVCEAHLIDYDGSLDAYGWTIRLELHEWMRDQLTYTNVEPLQEQLRRDIALARRMMGSATGDTRSLQGAQV